MAHIQYTICRSGANYYNRRVPKNAVKRYGPFIRVALSKDLDEAQAYARRLSMILEGSWGETGNTVPVDLQSVVESFKPRSVLLTEMAEEYLSLRDIDQSPSRLALTTFVTLAGDRDVSTYMRDDAKLFVRHLTNKGHKTATIRRRINSLSAILNYACAELDLEKRNPFSRLIIKDEGNDCFKRGVFTEDQLRQGYERALSSHSTVRLLVPILGETGCRIAEIVGLRVEDVDLDNDLVHIRPNAARRLKTRNSTRVLPLVGYAKVATLLALQKSDGEWLFPQYIKQGKCVATHSSNAVNKWLKKDFDGLTAHCLRRTMRDRLRAVECPSEMIDQIGGWKNVSGVGAHRPPKPSSRWTQGRSCTNNQIGPLRWC